MIKKLNRRNLPIIFILILSFTLNIANIGIQGYGNKYYAAGIRGMLTSIRNFFFLSFDQSGFVTLNKPPLGLWIQGIFAKIFGFSGFSLILPEAIAGTVCVLILYILIKRYFGLVSAIISSLILTITPIFVAVSRTNDFQTIAILFMMLSIMPLIKATKTGKTRYLIISFIIIGLAFNVNGLECFIILPAIYLTYILSGPTTKRKVREKYAYGITFITRERHRISTKSKIRSLIIATIVLLVVSLSWSYLVDLVPANNRPYIGDSTTNSEIELVLNHYNLPRLEENSGININYNGDNTLSYNGLTLDRLILIENYNMWNAIHKNYESPLGFFKLFENNNVTDQISWFLPLAIICFIVSIINRRKLIVLSSAKNIFTVFFAIWFLTEFLYFSFGYTRVYDLATLAVPTAAMCGIGIRRMIDIYKKKRKIWLPLALGLNIIFQYVIVIYYRNNLYSGLRHFFYFDLGISIVSVGILFKIRSKVFKNNRIKNGLIGIALIGSLMIPLIGSTASLFYKTDGIFKGAGLQLFQTSTYEEVNSYMEGYGENFGGSENITKLINFLEENRGQNQEYLLVTPSASVYASEIILNTGEDVMPLGGRTGNDNIISLDAFKLLVKEGKIKYVLVGNQTESLNNAAIMNWVETVGTIIPNSTWQNENTIVANNMLYKVFKTDKRDTLYEVTPNSVNNI